MRTTNTSKLIYFYYEQYQNTQIITLLLGQPKVNKVKICLPSFKVYETATNQVSRWYHEQRPSY